MSWGSRRYSGGYGGFAPYESVASKKAKAKKKIAALKKKGQKISPVIIEGRTIAKTWWGKAWNQNLELYADLSNRLSRGRSYVTHGCVLDLQITKGRIKASVMGSGRNLYQCEVKIDSLNNTQWEKVKSLVSGKISSLTELLAGKFPKEMNEVLTKKNHGLFPAPSEFHPNCNCPDSARFCKHLAAVIYGIGNRLDSEPNLLFTLRGVEPNELVSAVVSEHKDNLISKAIHVKSKRVLKIKDSGLADIFDIDFSMPKKLLTKKKKTQRKR